jgi:hypothetical protein
MKTKPYPYIFALTLCILWSGIALTAAAENDAELLKQTTAILETRNLNDVSKGAAMFLRLAIDGNTNKA